MEENNIPELIDWSKWIGDDDNIFIQLNQAILEDLQLLNNNGTPGAKYNFNPDNFVSINPTKDIVNSKGLEDFRWRGGVTTGGKGFAFPLSTPSRLQYVFTLAKQNGVDTNTLVTILSIYDEIVAKTADTPAALDALSGMLTAVINPTDITSNNPIKINDAKLFKESFFSNDNILLNKSQLKAVQRQMDIGRGLNVMSPSETATAIQRGMQNTLIAPEDMYGNWNEAMMQSYNQKLENAMLLNGLDFTDDNVLAKVVAEIQKINIPTSDSRYVIDMLMIYGNDNVIGRLVQEEVESYIRTDMLLVAGENPYLPYNTTLNSKRNILEHLYLELMTSGDSELENVANKLVDMVVDITREVENRYADGLYTKGVDSNGHVIFKDVKTIITEHLENVFNAIDEAASNVKTGKTTASVEEINKAKEFLNNLKNWQEEEAEALGYNTMSGNEFDEYKPLTGGQSVNGLVPIDESSMQSVIDYDTLKSTVDDSGLFTKLDNIVGQVIYDNELGRGVIVGLKRNNTMYDMPQLEILFDNEVTYGQAQPNMFRERNYGKNTLDKWIMRAKLGLDPDVSDITPINFGKDKGYSYIVNEVGLGKRWDSETGEFVSKGTLKFTDPYPGPVFRSLQHYFIETPEGLMMIDNQSTRYGQFRGNANIPGSQLSDAEIQIQSMDYNTIDVDEIPEVLDNEIVTDKPTNVVDYQDTGVGGRPFEIEGGVPVDESGNPIKSVGAADETITIYRVVPEGVDSVNANDWVFINKGQAEEALKNANKNSDGNFNLIEMEVSRGDVYPSTRGNLEMGYFPKDTPTNADVTSMSEYKLKKHLDSLLNETKNVGGAQNLNPKQQQMIDDALEEMNARLNRTTFRVLDGGAIHSSGSILKAVGSRLGKLFVDGLTVIDIYELGLLAWAFGEPLMDGIVKFVYPDFEGDSRTYGEQLMENLELTAQISPTDRFIKYLGDEYEDAFGIRPSEIYSAVTELDTSPVRPVLSTPDTPVRDIDLPIGNQWVLRNKERLEQQGYEVDPLEGRTSPGEYKQFLSGLNGMIGG